MKKTLYTNTTAMRDIAIPRHFTTWVAYVTRECSTSYHIGNESVTIAIVTDASPVPPVQSPPREFSTTHRSVPTVRPTVPDPTDTELLRHWSVWRASEARQSVAAAGALSPRASLRRAPPPERAKWRDVRPDGLHHSHCSSSGQEAVVIGGTSAVASEAEGDVSRARRVRMRCGD